MGRTPRAAEGGLTYHVLNRATARLTLFEESADYESFLRVVTEALSRFPVKLYAFCVMPSHYHLILKPTADGLLSRFMGWISLTHTQRWHAHRGTAGTGPIYQGRFKSFPVQDDEHFQTLCRYVERNPLRANLVKRAEDWAWGSLRRQIAINPAIPIDDFPFPSLSPWPTARPTDWIKRVNVPMTLPETEAVVKSLTRCQPFGVPEWSIEIAQRLGLESTFRPRGRPRKEPGGGT